MKARACAILKLIGEVERDIHPRPARITDANARTFMTGLPCSREVKAELRDEAKKGAMTHGHALQQMDV